MAKIMKGRNPPLKGNKMAKKSLFPMPRPQPKMNKTKKNKNGGSKKVPRLPFSLKKEIDSLHPTSNDEEDQNVGEKLDGDDYEYEEDSAQEDTQKNKRYDQVDNLEFELPSDFEDEEIDEDTVFGHENFDHSDDDLAAKGMKKVDQKGKYKSIAVSSSDEEDGMSESEELNGESNHGHDSDEEDNGLDQMVARRKQQGFLSSEEEEEEEEEEEDDDEKHKKMLQDVTGRALDAFEGQKKKKVVISEAYPESEYNLDRKASGLTENLSVQDLMAPLYGKSGFGSLRKRMHQLEKNAMAVQAPLPKVAQARLERKAAYANTKEEIKKWQPLVKRNREASTVNLAKKANVEKNGTGAIAFAFEPTTDLEKNIASLLQDACVVEAQKMDGAELLELNKVTLEEVRERQGRLAKMRSLMFRHELKAKHIKKIKSKTYHRLLKKERRKSGLGDTSNDPEAAKEFSMKQEFKRAEERMTLRHKNTSKWAKRVLKRGLQTQDEGTKAALAEQLRMNTLLTRKIHSMNDDTTSDESSSEDDDNTETLLGSDDKLKSQIIAKAKEDTLKVLEGEEEDIPKSGILALPFMVRGIEKRKKQAHDEAVTALEEYESALRAENTDAGNGEEVNDIQKGRLVFGDLARQSTNKKNHKESKIEFEDMLVDRGDGSEDDSENNVEEDSMQNHKNTSFTDQLETDHKLSSEGLNFDFFGLCGMEGSVAPTMTETAGPVYVDSSNEQDECVNQNVLCDSHLNNLKTESMEKLFISKAKKSTLSELPNSNKWLFGESGAKMSEKLPAEIGSVTTRNHNKQQRKSKQENEGKIVPNGQKRNVKSSNELLNAGGAKVDFGKISNKKAKEISNPGISNNEISGNHPQSPDHDSSYDSEDETEKKAMPEGMVPIDSVGSQADLIQRAFAADDVEAEFEQAKAEAVNEEVPASETVETLPGWGQWTHIQQKKGLPSWILQQQQEERKKREEALRKRKDAKLKFVVISEKMDKKAAKYNASSLPFPYQSKEVFERSMRMPIGPEFNTIHAFQNMIRPTVIKKAGVVIDPIKYEKEQQPKDEIIHSAASSRKRKNSSNIDQNSNKNKKGSSKGQYQNSKLSKRFNKGQDSALNNAS